MVLIVALLSTVNALVLMAPWVLYAMSARFRALTALIPGSAR